MKRSLLLFLFFPFLLSGQQARTTEPFVVILGIAQDGGYPHAGCKKSCCLTASSRSGERVMITSLAIVDPLTNERWIVDATPDLPDQLRLLDSVHPVGTTPVPAPSPLANHLGLSGIFLTHAHVGHYTGLMFLGREAIGARKFPVYAMPRMTRFLQTNGPWDQLVQLENIEIRQIRNGVAVRLNDRITLTPFLVPHRDEYSETVGYRIEGPSRSILFIPDIDKWDKWNTSIIQAVVSSDYAFLDGTFFEEGEIPGRSMSGIPHPFIVESIQKFNRLPEEARSKIHFLHLNHTNPVFDPQSQAHRQVIGVGFRLAAQGSVFPL